MLTAKGEEVDRVVGLELGADDYIVKPFGMAELSARVRSALRRGALSKNMPAPPRPHELHIGDAVVDLDAMRGERAGKAFALTPKEAAMLRHFAENEGRVLSREELLEAVWDIDCDVTTRTVDQHMLRLRQKLEKDPAEPRFFQTVHGAGYRFAKGV